MNITTYKLELQNVHGLLKDVECVTLDIWKNFIVHVIKEDRFCQIEYLTDDILDKRTRIASAHANNYR